MLPIRLFTEIKKSNIESVHIDEHYKNFKPTLDLINESSVEKAKNLARITQQCKDAVNSNNLPADIEKIQQTLNIENADLSRSLQGFGKYLEQNTVEVNTNLSGIAQRNNAKGLYNPTETFIEQANSLKDNLFGGSVQVDTTPYAQIVEGMSNAWAYQGLQNLDNIKHALELNYTITTLFVEHKVCIAVGLLTFSAFVYDEIHQRSRLNEFVDATIRKIYETRYPIYYWTAKTIYTYKRPIFFASIIIGTGTFAVHSYALETAALKDKYHFDGLLGAAVGAVGDLARKTAYSGSHVMNEARRGMWRGLLEPTIDAITKALGKQKSTK